MPQGTITPSKRTALSATAERMRQAEKEALDLQRSLDRVASYCEAGDQKMAEIWMQRVAIAHKGFLQRMEVREGQPMH